MEKVDYLIVGQGLAGSLMAGLLLQRHRAIRVIDNRHRSAASAVAAGIINPITGKRLNRPCLVEQLLQTAFATYEELEQFLGARFFSRRRVLRLLNSRDEASVWQKRQQQKEYESYVAPIAGNASKLFPIRFGGFEVTRSGQIDLPAFLQATRQFLKRSGCLIESDFNHQAVRSFAHGVEWEQYCADYLIFCEGYKVTQNPFFAELALNPAKGEVLTLDAPDFQEARIIQCGKWIFRSVTGSIKAGTTYRWDHLNEAPTEAGRVEIEQGLQTFCRFPYRVVDHQAAVRPIIRADNRPAVGIHPRQPRLAILNGLGSKGALQAPFAAKELIARIEENKYIHPGFDICRESLWSTRGSA